MLPGRFDWITLPGHARAAAFADARPVSRQLWPVVVLPFALAALAGMLALQASRPGDARVERVDRRVTRNPLVATAPQEQARAPRAARAQALAPAVVARVTGSRVAVRSRPGGTVARFVGRRTEFGSPRALGVVRRQGRWLGVTLPELGNGRLGWVDARGGGLATRPTRVRLEVDLSARRLVLRRGGRVRAAMRVSVGRPGSSTPTGRFAVTDKLPGARYSPVYGCCILALSGRQPHLPAGWTGGDRLAIHGSGGGAAIGSAASAGCLHAHERDLRKLMRQVPLGAPVVIRA